MPSLAHGYMRKVGSDVLASGVRVWIATGHTDKRRGMSTLALQVQEALKRDPHGGDLYVFWARAEK